MGVGPYALLIALAVALLAFAIDSAYLLTYGKPPPTPSARDGGSS